MKRIIFLSIVTLFAISNYAQIEGFDESELNAQLSKTEQGVFDKSKILLLIKSLNSLIFIIFERFCFAF